MGDNLTQIIHGLWCEYMATNIYRNEFFLASYVTCGFSDLVLRIVAWSTAAMMILSVYSPRMRAVSHHVPYLPAKGY